MNLTPVSGKYLLRVKERAMAVIDDSSGEGGIAKDDVQGWSDWILSTVLAQIDTDLRLTEQEADLREVTPCLRVDLAIVESLMEKARQKKKEALQQGKPAAIMRLIALQYYLNDRFKALLLGARDPTYQDITEGNAFGFDAGPLWCCPGKSENPENEGEERVCAETGSDDQFTCLLKGGVLSKRMESCLAAGCTTGGGDAGKDRNALCPFDTDYLPPTSTGYGCDRSVLSAYSSLERQGVKKEYEALDALMESRDTFIKDAGPLKDVTETIAEALGLPPPDLTHFQAGQSSSISHRKISGCLDSAKDWPAGAGAIERRGAFSVDAQHVPLLDRLTTLWQRWGSTRVPPDYLKSADELPEDSEHAQRVRDTEKSSFSWFYLGGRTLTRGFLAGVGQDQQGRESTMIAKVSDAPLQIAQSLKPLRSQVRSLVASVAKPDEGIRGFVRNYAFFLRRSCIYRPCNSALDRILKMVFKDECFPYASGKAQDNPNVADECEDAAK